MWFHLKCVLAQRLRVKPSQFREMNNPYSWITLWKTVQHYLKPEKKKKKMLFGAKTTSAASSHSITSLRGSKGRGREQGREKPSGQTKVRGPWRFTFRAPALAQRLRFPCPSAGGRGAGGRVAGRREGGMWASVLGRWARCVLCRWGIGW